MNNENLYWYKAKVVSVYDGDTITVNIDLGLNITRRETVRLYGINTPELRGSEKEEGIKSRNWLQMELEPYYHTDGLFVHTIKDKSGKYGRLLAELWIGDRCLNHELVEKGLAREYMV